MPPLGNKKATERPLTAANSRKGLLPCRLLLAAFPDRTAKSPNSRKRPQRIQAFLSPETGVRIPVAVWPQRREPDHQRERDAALDERLAKALGGSESDVYLRTIETCQARVDVLLEKRAERDQKREPAQIEADIEQVWEDLSLENRRRVLHSVFDSVFAWRTSDSRHNGKLPSVEQAAYSLPAKDRPPRPEGARGKSERFPGATDARQMSRANGGHILRNSSAIRKICPPGLW